MTALPRPHRAAAVVLAVFAAAEVGFAIWAAFTGHGRVVDPRVGYGPDSALYLAAARSPVWSRGFLAGPGPFGFLLLAKLCARNLRAIVLVQSVIAAGAWAFLASTVAGVMRNNLARWVGFVGILGVALAPGVLQWNAMITTESLSLSTLCAVVACAIRLAQRGTRRELAWFLAALAAFAFTRDTNALVAGGIGVVALACAVRPVWRVRAAAIGAVGVALAVGATAFGNAARPPRWYWPVAETTAVRLLDDPGATRYLVDHGFPWDAQTRTLPQRYVYISDQVTAGSDFAAFRHWVRVDGRRVYGKFLLTHPGWALRKPFDARDAFFDLGTVEVYGRVYRNRPGGLFTVAGTVGAPRAPGVTEVWTVAAAVALALLAWRRRVRPALAGAVALIGAFAIVGYYAAWHGDALEVYRHALSAAVQLRIALWVVTALVVDALMTRRADSDVRVPEDADLDQEEHEGAPRDQPAGAVADLGAYDCGRTV